MPIDLRSQIENLRRPVPEYEHDWGDEWELAIGAYGWNGAIAAILKLLDEEKMNERDYLKTAVSNYLKTLEPFVLWQKNWGGGIYAKVGVADFTGCAQGKFFAIEIKHPSGRGKVAKDQSLYLSKVNDAGGNTCVATSLVEVQEFMRKLLFATSDLFQA